MSKAYQIPVIITVAADSYQEAIDRSNETLGQCKEVVSAGPYEMNMALATGEIEHDGSMAHQRVLYLHSEDEPIEVENF